MVYAWCDPDIHYMFCPQANTQQQRNLADKLVYIAPMWQASQDISESDHTIEAYNATTQLQLLKRNRH